MHPDRFGGRPQSEIEFATKEFQRLTHAQEALLTERAGTQNNAGRSGYRSPEPEDSRDADLHVRTEVTQHEAIAGNVISVITPKVGTIKIRLPENIVGETTVRVPGLGKTTSGGVGPGDLYVTVVVRPHSASAGRSSNRYDRGADAFVAIILSKEQATPGYPVWVETPQGSRSMFRITDAILDRKLHKIPGKGHASLGRGPAGDLFVEFTLAQPAQEVERRWRSGPWPWVIGAIALTVLWASVAGVQASGSAGTEHAEFEVTIADGGECSSNELDANATGCWEWNLVLNESCAGAIATFALYETLVETTASQTVESDLGNLTQGQSVLVALPADESMPQYAVLEDIECSPS